MKHAHILTLLISVSALTTHAQDIREQEVKRILSTLAADDMEGRKTFEPGIEKAARFLENEFTKAGLQPLAGATNFRQAFHRYNTTPGPRQVHVGKAEIRAERVIVLGVAPAIDWNQNSDVDVQTLPASEQFYDYLRKLRDVKKNTLVWVDTAHTDDFNKFYENLQQKGSKNLDSLPSVVLVLKQAEDTDLKTWDVKASQQVTPLYLSNIVGMIRGKTKPDEYVIFSGHYDHLGIVKPVGKDSIANGADDDASGVTAVVMLAKYYKQHPPARSLIFVAFTAEEIGGYGSRYFSQKQDPDKVVAMFNIEMIGKESKFGKNSAFITGYERSDFGKILEKNLQNSIFHFYPDPYPEQSLFYRSDNATLARQGVPAHTISTDQIDSDKLYHSVGDEVSTLDIKNITSTIQAIAISARSIVAGTDTPARIDKEGLKR
ncbi:M28 family metallopeptidase [Chitinophaga silvisoli]|uniref:M20/M25/M40 family metallo-hydrolase n=1 Tax=Chitinophaga silvisoli TaxID=2291814 RepID=A0A3E1P405_9BACT|nr:M20/M25/M40 family metallo-hydrolase [Chitinophaga silvisoli]RFM34901.1 M20/M25/M40 family metallo-hydrolase [Chitinophaga silvisoli]